VSSFHPSRLQNVVRSFIRTEHWHDRFAATLTLRQARYVMSEAGLQVRVPLTAERASQNFRHFLNLLSGRVYGASWKRYGKRVRAFPVLEGGTIQRMHFHALIECPRDDLASSYPSLIEQCWQRTDWGYTQVRVSSGADNGWVRYMTKLRSKPDFASSIDWMNFRN
jgi:hypothetical protein